MGSSPCRRISLLAFAHPVVGPPFQVQVRCRRLTRIRDRTYEISRIVALIYILKIYMGCNLNSYGLLFYSHVLICLSIDAGAQVVIILLSYRTCVVIVIVWDRFCIWVELPVQRRLYPIFNGPPVLGRHNMEKVIL